MAATCALLPVFADANITSLFGLCPKDAGIGR